MERSKKSLEIRWDLAMRYRLIETIALWEGRLTTQHLIQNFGISRQQASKDINSYISEHAPRNLTYDASLKGYTPTRQFRPRFIDGSASAYLHMLNQSRERAPHIEGLERTYAHTEVLEVPDRSVRPEVLRPLLRACREGLRLEAEYVSFNTPWVEVRVIAPHTLVFTGMRWHVRAYCEKNRAWRDFVLSRFRGTPELLDPTPHGRDYDPGWNTKVDVIIEPDARLLPEQKRIIETDYAMQDGRLVLPSRGALVQYVLKRYGLDPTKSDPNPAAQQIQVTNLEALKQWLY
ncbi:MAG TPA: WYL domain-containing protein [Pseudomonas sp.]|nr:WYL domain-containing protein [Pseudomonas sp.]